MCGLRTRPRTDVDPPRFLIELPSAAGGHIVSPPAGAIACRVSCLVQVDLSRVRSCVAFGTGSGDDEIDFVRDLLPSLGVFIAVEPDPESIEVTAVRRSTYSGN